MVAPLAVITIAPPEQIVGEGGVTVNVGVGFTVIDTVVVSAQAPLVPITVYVILLVGFAMVVGQIVQLRPVGGLHV